MHKPEFKNKYILLRHGKNIHQTELKEYLYRWPDDNPPCTLIEEGIKDVERAGEILKDKQIDCIFASDILRIKQTVEIVTKKIGFDLNKVVYDQRLRDINWGIFGGQKEVDGWKYYSNDYMKRYEVAPPEGESWKECQERMVVVLNSIEEQYQNKTILIVSHGDPLWLLEGYMWGMDIQEMIDKKEEMLIQPGEVKVLML